MGKSVLDDCTNMLGELSPSIKKRVKRFVNNPTPANWDDISGVIIDGQFLTTIWQAVIKIDPTFPRHGRTTDAQGNVIREWERIPTPLQVLQAIKAEKPSPATS